MEDQGTTNSFPEMEDQGTTNSFPENIETIVSFDPCSQLHLVEKGSFFSYSFIYVITDEKIVSLFPLTNLVSTITSVYVSLCHL